MTESTGTCWEDAALPPEDSLRLVSSDGLARAIRAGDEEAFNCFYALYADRTYRYLFSILPRDEAVVRDAFQETMLRVVRYIKPMPDEQLWGWLTRVARTALYDQLRRNTRRTAREGAYRDEQQGVERPEGKEAEEHLLAALRAAMDDLDEDDRELVEAFYFRREPQARIAEQGGITRKAVESRLGRIRRSMRKRMKELLRREG